MEVSTGASIPAFAPLRTSDSPNGAMTGCFYWCKEWKEGTSESEK
jgi:hypothetical protein